MIQKIGLLRGATYPFRVIALFWRSPKLWPYLIMPIVVNFIIGTIFYSAVTFFGWQEMGDLITSLSIWLERITADLPSWLEFLTVIILSLANLLRVILILVLLMITGLIFLQLGVILGAPWYGKLSEALERNYTGTVENIEVGIIKDIGRAILFELKKLILIISVTIPLLIINFLPLIGTIISTIGSFILSGTIVCLDFFDSPLERRRLKFRSKLQFIIQSLPASAIFSAVCLLLISIPLLNLITIPICIASGTLFFCDLSLIKKDKKPESFNG